MSSDYTNNTSNNKKQILSIGALILTGAIWGSAFVVIKDSLGYITPLWQLTLRLLVAAVPAGITAILLRNRWSSSLFRHSLVLGAAFFAALAMQNVGQVYTTASKCGFLTATYAGFVPILQLLFCKKKPSGRQFFASFICIAGAFLLSIGESFSFQPKDLPALACGFLYAVHILVTDRYREDDGLLLHVGQILCAAFLAIPTAFLLEAFPTVWNIRVVSSLIYLGLMEIFLCFFLQIFGQKNTPPALASILLSLEGVFSAVFGYIFLGEIMTPVMLVGGAMIFVAAVISGL